MVSPLSSSAPRASGRCWPSRPAIVTPPAVKSTRPAAAAASPANAAEISASSMPLRLRRNGADLPMLTLDLEVVPQRDRGDVAGERVDLDVGVDVGVGVLGDDRGVR